jgi:hypothetical protein
MTKTDDVRFNVEDIFHTYDPLGRPERQGEAVTILAIITYSLCNTEYHMSHEKINIVLGLSVNSSTDPAPTTGNSSTDGTPDLVPTTDDVFRICPRYVRMVATCYYRANIIIS